MADSATDPYDPNNDNLLRIVIIILGIMYTLVFIFSLLRSWRVKDDPKTVKVFYAIVCLQIFISALLFGVILVVNWEDVTVALLSLIPSILMMINYYMMFLLLFDQILSSRSAKSTSYRRKIRKSKLIQFLIGISATLIFVFVILNLVFMILSAKNEYLYKDFRSIFLATWFSVIFWFLVALLVVYFKQSGVPYKSAESRKTVRHVAVIFFLWTFAFILKLIVTILGFAFYEHTKGPTTMVQAIFIVVVNTATDIAPYLSILEVKFIEVFRKARASSLDQRDPEEEEKDQVAQVLLVNPSIDNDGRSSVHLGTQETGNLLGPRKGTEDKFNQYLGANNQDKNLSFDDYLRSSIPKQDFFVIPEGSIKQHINLRQKSFRNNEKSILENKLLLNPKSYQLLEIFNKPWYANSSCRKSKLGVFYRATLKQETVLCRVIEFERMTNYILEDYFIELTRLDMIKIKSYIMPTIGYNIKDSTLLIFQPEMLSLFDLLHSQDKDETRRALTQKDKYVICLNIAKIFFTLHQFTPPICHSHLTSHNIFLEISISNNQKKLKVRLGDIELLPLIKYANTFYNYRSSSVWSSPECLSNLKKQADPTPEMDVYSFGMLLWEFWHETIPFDGDLKLCQQYVLNEDSRPMIMLEEQKCDQEMAKLIRLCWQSNPENRPSFGYICTILSQINMPQS